MKTYQELEDIYLKTMCLLQHSAESVVLFNDISYFPPELIEPTKILVKKFERFTKDSLTSLAKIANGNATVEDYNKVVEDSYFFTEQILLIIYEELHESTLETLNNKENIIIIEEN